KLDEVTSWTRSALREDSPELRSQIAKADVLVTTWHSPFLTREMLGDEPRVKLIAHCGGEVKSRVAEEIFAFVTITNAADPMARGVAEMALAASAAHSCSCWRRSGLRFSLAIRMCTETQSLRPARRSCNLTNS